MDNLLESVSPPSPISLQNALLQIVEDITIVSRYGDFHSTFLRVSPYAVDSVGTPKEL